MLDLLSFSRSGNLAHISKKKIETDKVTNRISVSQLFILKKAMFVLGFKTIFRRATHRLDNCSPELFAVEVASFT